MKAFSVAFRTSFLSNEKVSAILLVASLEYSDRKEAFAGWRGRNHWKRERCDERLQLGFQGLRVLHELAR